MSAILFDLDGVLYQGDAAITGAADTIDWAVKKQIPHLFLTNTTSRPRAALLEKLNRFSIPANIDEILTPPLAAVQLLRERNCQRLALLVPEATRVEFSMFSDIKHASEEIDALVVGDLGEDWNFARLNFGFKCLMNNPQAILLALGMTRYWRGLDGLQLDTGPFVKALEYASGREAIVTGKPAASFYRAAKNMLGVNQRIYMIGDDIRSDIEAAQAAGLTALLVRTGKYSEHDLSLNITPDATLSSIADLPNWWRTHVD